MLPKAPKGIYLFTKGCPYFHIIITNDTQASVTPTTLTTVNFSANKQYPNNEQPTVVAIAYPVIATAEVTPILIAMHHNSRAKLLRNRFTIVMGQDICDVFVIFTHKTSHITAITDAANKIQYFIVV